MLELLHSQPNQIATMTVTKVETAIVTTEGGYVFVPYHTGQNGLWWNETCAMVMEIFGLPGDRYTTQVNPDVMAFYFKNPKDLTLCQLLLSDRLLTLD